MVVVLSKAGAQVPIMPFSDVTGKVIAGAPLQIAGIGSKVGIRAALMVRFRRKVSLQPSAFTVI